LDLLVAAQSIKMKRRCPGADVANKQESSNWSPSADAICQKESKMKKLFWGIAVLWLSLFADAAPAQVTINVGVEPPPPLLFTAPPDVIVLPNTYVYVVPDIEEDVYFFDGWWWRQWSGHWYRSNFYDREWGSYPSIPGFYTAVPHNWRIEYREHYWNGRPWNYERIPHQQVQRHWNSWEKEEHWKTHKNRGVQESKYQSQLKPHVSANQPDRMPPCILKRPRFTTVNGTFNRPRLRNSNRMLNHLMFKKNREINRKKTFNLHQDTKFKPVSPKVVKTGNIKMVQIGMERRRKMNDAFENIIDEEYSLSHLLFDRICLIYPALNFTQDGLDEEHDRGGY
jgi:hypothetical protein